MASTTDNARPATVTVATALMTVTAAGYLITGFALFGQLGRTRAWIRDEFQEIDPDNGPMLAFSRAALVVVALLTIVVALVLLGAAAAARSGSQTGRIVAWVVMGLLLLCGSSAAARGGTPDLGNNVTVWRSRSDGTGAPTTVVNTLPDSYVTAYRIGSGVFGVLAMIALIVAIVLLTRPSANSWFRPRPPAGGPPPGYHPLPHPGPGGPPPGPSGARPAAPARVPGPSGPSWSRPVEGPGSVRPPAAPARTGIEADLAVLTRRHQRGEITDAEFAAARARLTER
jgi:hypothetical protein